MTENTAWLVRSGALIPDQMYILFVCDSPPTTGDGVSWWGPESNTPAQIIREDLIRRLRPDLLLEPGGGPVRVEPLVSAVRPGDFGDLQVQIRDILTQRDVLVEAAREMLRRLKDISAACAVTRFAQSSADDGTRTQWFDESAIRERERLTRERNALLAAARSVAEVAVEERSGVTICHGTLEAIRAAVAECERNT